GKLPYRYFCIERLELPQGGVECVARAARRKQLLQRIARETLLHLLADLLDDVEHVLLVVAEIINAGSFAPADLRALRDPDDDRRHRLEHITRDSEGLREADGRFFDGQRARGGGRCHADCIAMETKVSNIETLSLVLGALFRKPEPHARRVGQLLNALTGTDREDGAGLGAGADVTVGHAAVEIDRVAGAQRKRRI